MRTWTATPFPVIPYIPTIPFPFILSLLAVACHGSLFAQPQAPPSRPPPESFFSNYTRNTLEVPVKSSCRQPRQPRFPLRVLLLLRQNLGRLPRHQRAPNWSILFPTIRTPRSPKPELPALKTPRICYSAFGASEEPNAWSA